jgi:iron(III) transport system permease protein
MTTEAPPRPSTPQPSIDSRSWEPPRWRRYLPTPKFLTLGVVTLIIAYLAIVPLYYLFWGTFFDEAGLTFAGFERAYGNDQIFGLVKNSLVFAVGAAAPRWHTSTCAPTCRSRRCSSPRRSSRS